MCALVQSLTLLLGVVLPKPAAAVVSFRLSKCAHVNDGVWLLLFCITGRWDREHGQTLLCSCSNAFG